MKLVATLTPVAVAFAGTTCVAVGLWMIYPPLALILGGLALVYCAYLGDRSWAS